MYPVHLLLGFLNSLFKLRRLVVHCGTMSDSRVNRLGMILDRLMLADNQSMRGCQSMAGLGLTADGLRGPEILAACPTLTTTCLLIQYFAGSESGELALTKARKDWNSGEAYP
jgi:hypothetical protein